MEEIEIIYLVIGFVITYLVGKFVNKVEKFLKLIESIVTAFADMKITADELKEIFANLKELLKKKNSSP